MDRGETVRPGQRDVASESERVNALEVDRDVDASDRSKQSPEEPRTESRRQLSRLDRDTADSNPQGYRRLARMEGRLLTPEEDGVLRASERRFEVEREVASRLPRHEDTHQRENE